MSETWLNLDSEHGAARLSFKGLNGARGVGGGQLIISAELSSRKEVADGKAIWLTGTVQVKNLGPMSGHLGVLRTQIHPIVLPERGGTYSATFTCDVSYFQLQAIEEHRIKGVTLFIDFSGYWLHGGLPRPFWNAQFDVEVQQSDWINILEQVGYRRILLLEFDAPQPQTPSSYSAAFAYFADAQKCYLEHEWRRTVEALRQCLAALVGKDPEDEDESADVSASLKTVRQASRQRSVAYGERIEPVRLALKFLCDLGAHPEVAETERVNAQSALLMVAGLMQGYARP